MSEQEPRTMELGGAREAVVRTRRGISLVWLIPVLALVVGAFVAYKAIVARGPEITIEFASGAGLEAGKTKVKYKEIEVGLLESIELAPDLSGVVCRVRMAKGMGEHLTEQTRFWVVTARVAGGEVTGLGTLFSGAYIGMDPGREGGRARRFKGLEVAPVVTSEEPGRHFVLHSAEAGSPALGTPVLYHKIQVGRVVESQLDPSGSRVIVRIFVDAPYDRLVHPRTRFWNASGIDINMSAEGVSVDTESLVSILIGGIAFDTPLDAVSEPAAEETVFPLYENQVASRAPVYTDKTYFLLHFDQSVRGLSPGAPVELGGIQVGEVTDVKLAFDPTTRSFRIPVVIEFERERIAGVPAASAEERRERLESLVAAGLRAQLKSGNLLTGQLYVALDMHPDAKPAQIVWSEPYPELPTLPTPLEEITASLTHLAERLGKVPVDQIGDELRATLSQTEGLTRQLNQDLAPTLQATLAQAERTLASANSLVNPDSAVQQELRRALFELADAARSLGLAAELIEREPESVIFGTQGSQ